MAKILVLAEQHAGNLRKSTLAAITLAKEIGDGFDIGVIGAGVGGVAEALQPYGADKIYLVDDAALEHYLAQPYKDAIVALVEHAGAEIVTVPAGTFGKDVLPRVAAALGAGMVSDCIGYAGDGVYLRPMYAGNVVASVKVNTDKTLVSVRGSDFDAAAPTGGASPVEALSVSVGEGGARFVSFDATESERPELTEADVVVSGGRGLKDGASFWNMMNPLADVLGAAIGATRAAVDSWEEVPNDMQVGQTGKVVAPTLYVAVALSGAIQHLAGMKSSKTIVAINKDPEAPVFQISDYGLVADAFKVVPDFVEQLKAAK